MIESSTITPSRAALPRGRAMRRALGGNPLLPIGGGLGLLVAVIPIFAPLIAPVPADAGTATHPFEVLRAPSAAHWFGTDQVGRDIFSRVLFGARVSPVIAIIVLVIACLVGIPLGVAAGFLGGWVDEVIMRVTDVFLAFPPLLLALALAAVLPASLTSVTIAIAAVWWPWSARLIRGPPPSAPARPSPAP